jgi:hypothetical protein
MNEFDMNLPSVSGGIHLHNMREISMFDKVTMKNLFAVDGGCLSITLDQDYRLLRYNERKYNLSNVKLTHCNASRNGGAFYIDNIKNMTLSKV